MLPFGIVLHYCSAVIIFPTVLAGIVHAAPRATRNSNDAITLFPREIMPGGKRLVPYFTSISLVRRDQTALGTSEDIATTTDSDIDALELPQVGQAIELLYGEENPTSTNPFITKITFTPPEDRVLLVLENYLRVAINQNDNAGKKIFTQVTCEASEATNANITLVLSKLKATSAEQFDRWLQNLLADPEKELVVITSDIMPECGKQERLAFLVKSAELGVSTTSLSAAPLEWSLVARTLSIVFGKASTIISSGIHGSLTKRLFDDIPGFFTSTIPDFIDDTFGGGDDENEDLNSGSQGPTITPTASSTPKDEGDDDKEDDDKYGGGDLRILDRVNLTKKITIPPRITLLPLPSDILPQINTDLPFDIPFLPQEDGQNNMNETNNTATDPGLTVTCVNCDLTGLIGFHGVLDLETSLKDLKVAEVQRAFIGVEVIEHISARLELEFVTGENAVEFAFQHSIFPSLGEESGILLQSFGVNDVFQIAPYFDYAIGVSVALSAPQTNVTLGGELRVSKSALLTWDIVNGNSTQEGWDVELTTFPVMVNSAPAGLEGLSLGVNFTSIPSVTLNLEVGPVFDVGARLAMLLPRVYTRSTVVQNVTSSCTVPGTDDYTYFPTALVFESGLHTALYGELYADADIDIGSFTKGNISLTAGVAYTHTIWEHTHPFNHSCLLFGDSKTGLGKLRNLTIPDVAESEQVYDLNKIEQQYVKDGELPPGIDVAKLKNQQGLSEILKTALGMEHGSVQQANGSSDQDAGNGSDERNAAIAMARVFGPVGNGDRSIIQLWVVAVLTVTIWNWSGLLS